MAKAVLDTTVLVSAFLARSADSPSVELLRFIGRGQVEAYISEDIIQETRRVLLNRKSIRRRYAYTDDDVQRYLDALVRLATVVSGTHDLPGVVPRDPSDDMIVACAVEAAAEYLVTRDNDLLSLGRRRGIVIITPEEFLHLLRARD
ncbi:MAG: putative toxin-antitoxin system toxin component, PIN family [Xanthobacteraceae bacterium]